MKRSPTHRSEDDVTDDEHLARSRAQGGRAADEGPSGPRRSDDDGLSTTGVDETGEFVGRVAGDDVGYAEETGAEARAEGEGEGAR